MESRRCVVFVAQAEVRGNSLPSIYIILVVTVAGWEASPRNIMIKHMLLYTCQGLNSVFFGDGHSTLNRESLS